GPEQDPIAIARRLESVRSLPGDAAGVLGHVLGALPGEREVGITDLAPAEFQRVLFQAVGRLLESLASQMPLVVELDDLHWADPSSIDLLLEVVGLTERVPMLLLCAFRPERDAAVWCLRERVSRDLPHRSTEVVLQPLSMASCARLVGELLGPGTLPAELSTILERAAGTPLWVEELIRTLLEQRLLVQVDGQWRGAAHLARGGRPGHL